jgi:two-component system response regulator HydG
MVVSTTQGPDPAPIEVREIGTGASVLVVEDDETFRGVLIDILTGAGHAVVAVGDGQAALEALEHGSFEVVLLDLNLPRVSGINVLSAQPALHTDARFIVMTAFGTVDSAVEAMKLGAHDYLRKPFREEEVLFLVARAHDDVALRRELADARRRDSALGFEGMVGRTPIMRLLFTTIGRVAPTRATVLVQGETGTGKELVAHAIHAASGRSRRRFVAVNCSALSDTLLESELFGHERGAFTGAIQSRKGWIEEAAGGTLFLDEVSTLSSDIQVKLLRVLQERVIHRVGSHTPIAVDFRLITATNRDLAKLVQEGRFREDLFYRLSVFPLRVPPLRERAADVPLLTQYFRIRMAEELGVKAPDLDREVLARMMQYDWPGNVRELENFVERTLIMGSGADPKTFDLFGANADPADALLDRALVDEWTLDRLEREFVLATLHATAGQQSEAARRLGVNRRTIHRKLKQYRNEGHLP